MPRAVRGARFQHNLGEMYSRSPTYGVFEKIHHHFVVSFRVTLAYDNLRDQHSLTVTYSCKSTLTSSGKPSFVICVKCYNAVQQLLVLYLPHRARHSRRPPPRTEL